MAAERVGSGREPELGEPNADGEVETISDFERHGDGNVVGWPVPAARVARDAEIAHPLLKGARDPDVIEPPAAIAHRPVGGAVTPPCIDFLGLRNSIARDVDPLAVGLRRQKFFAFDRGVRYHLQ